MSRPQLTSQASPMNARNSPFERLQNCRGVDDLKRELRVLCAPFGAIVRLDVLRAPRTGKRQAICLWRMESREREDRLMSEFGVGRFGGDLVTVVELNPVEGQFQATGWGDSRLDSRFMGSDD
jgi:hypothetical protein